MNTTAAPGKARRLAWFGIGTAGTLVALYRVYGWAAVASGDLRGSDYFSFYAAARLLTSRGGAHLYEAASQRLFQDQVTAGWHGHFILLPFLHPPYYAVLIAPVALLSLVQAYAATSAVSLLLLAAALLASTRAAGLGIPETWIAGALTLSFLPVFAVFIQGQSDMVVLLPLCLAHLAWVRGRPGWAGVFAGLAIVKPQLLLLLPVLFIVQRHWRALAGYFAAAGALLAASLPFFGVAGWVSYIGVIAPWAVSGSQDFPITGQTVYSMRGLLEAAPGGAPLAAGVLAIVAVGAVALLSMRSRSPGLDLAFAVAVSLLLSPYQNLHDLSLLVMPAIAVAGMAQQGILQRPRLGMAVVLLAYLLGNVTEVLGPHLAALGVLALSVYLGWERLEHRPGRAAAVPATAAS